MNTLDTCFIVCPLCSMKFMDDVTVSPSTLARPKGSSLFQSCSLNNVRIQCVFLPYQLFSTQNSFLVNAFRPSVSSFSIVKNYLHEERVIKTDILSYVFLSYLPESIFYI